MSGLRNRRFQVRPLTGAIQQPPGFFIGSRRLFFAPALPVSRRAHIHWPCLSGKRGASAVEVPSEPKTQPPAEQPAGPLPRLPYCHPTTEPCPRLIAPRHPANLREAAVFAEGFYQIDRALARSLSAGRDQFSIVSCQG